MFNRLVSRSGTVWLSLVVTVGWLLSFVPLLFWWGAFLFGHRQFTEVENLETITMAWVGIPLAAIFLNYPLARQASKLLDQSDLARQSPQIRLGAAMYAVVLLVGTATWAFDERISYVIALAKAGLDK